MQDFPLGLVLLGILLVLMLFGVTQRIFDKMRLSMLWAVILIIAVGVGVLIPSISIGTMFTFSIGGFLIPFIVCLYLLFTAEAGDIWRAFLGMVITGAATLLILWFVPMNTLAMRIMTAIVIGLIAGGISYLIGRSRRGAFFSAVMGIYLAELVVFLIQLGIGTPGAVLALGANFNALVIAAITAVLLAVVVGELSERMVTGVRNNRQLNYEAGEYHEHDEFGHDSYGRTDKARDWNEHDYDDFYRDE